MRVFAFRALRPTPELAQKVAALPYDVMDSEEAREMAKGNPDCFLHITKPEIDLEKGVDLYSDAVYAKARENLQDFIKRGVLIQESEDAIYLYRQQMGDHIQTGIVACAHIDDYAQGKIKRHELTRKDKEDDRTRHVTDTGINAGPVFLAYRDNKALSEMIDKDSQEKPLYDFTAEDGIRHTVWKVANPGAYVAQFEQVESAYIADGHHRAASAYRAGCQWREKLGEGEHCRFLSVLFAASQLKILPYNRVIKDLNCQTQASILTHLKGLGTVTEKADPAPGKEKTVSIYMNGSWYGFEFALEQYKDKDAVGRLDVALMQSLFFTPLFDIQDPRTDKRIDFVGGIRGTKALEDRVDKGDAKLAVSMYPTSVLSLFDVSDADQLMPPKSTWFEPKLRSGLLIHRSVEV